MKQIYLFFVAILLGHTLWAQTPDAGEDTTICTNELKLYANTPTVPGTGTWKDEGGSATFDDKNSPTTMVRNLNKGQNTLTWTIDGYGSDEILVFNYQVNTAEIDEDSRNICIDSTGLVGTTPINFETGLWTVTSGEGSFTSPSLNATYVKNIPPGTHKYRWTLSFDKCESYDEIIINSYVVKLTPQEDFHVCGTTAQLEASEPYPGNTGKWSILFSEGSIENPNNHITNAIDLNVGVSEFKWVETSPSQGCKDSFTVTITNDQYYAYAGENTEICSKEYLLQANEVFEGTAKWVVHSGAGTFKNETNHKTVVSNMNQGINEFKWLVTLNGCESYDLITLNNRAVYPDAGADDTICVDYTTLDANTPPIGITANWIDISEAVTFSSYNDGKANVSDLLSGQNLLVWHFKRTTPNSDGKYCEDWDTVNIVNASFDIWAGGDKEVCNSQTQLNANNLGSEETGQWILHSGTGTILSPSNNKTEITNMTYGENIFVWKVSRAKCHASDTIIVFDNNHKPDPGKALDSTCDATYLLNAPEYPKGSGKWSIFTGMGEFDNPYDRNATVSNLLYGKNELKWTVTIFNCVYDTVITIRNNKVTTYAGPDQEVCEGSVQMQGQAPPSNGYGLWTFTDGEGTIVDETLKHTYINSLRQGNNYLKWTIYHRGCEGVDSVLVKNHQFQANGGNDTTILYQTMEMRAELPPFATAEWSVYYGNATILDKNSINTKISGLSVGQNIFKWTVMWGACPEEDYVTITNNGVEKMSPFAYEPIEEGSMTYKFAPLRQDIVDQWFWNFGDGTTTNEKNPQHTFKGGRVYDVCMSVYDDETQSIGQSCQKLVFDTISCKANFGYSLKNDTLFFTNHSSDTANTFFWELPDGSYSYEKNPKIEFKNEGYHKVRLTISNQTGCSDFIEKEILLKNYECNANFIEYIDRASNTVFFAYNQIDNARFFWDFGDGATETTKTPVHQYPKAGFYNVSLTVLDTSNGKQCIDKVSRDILISEKNNDCQADFSWQNSSVDYRTVKFFQNGIATDTMSYLWNFGNGIKSTEANPIYTYPEDGKYNACLVIKQKNHEGIEDFKCRQIIIATDTNAVHVKSDYIYFPNDNVRFNFYNTSSENATQWTWTFGDNQTAQTKETTYQYALEGYYLTSLKAEDTLGNADLTLQMLKAQFQNAGLKTAFTYKTGKGLKNTESYPVQFNGAVWGDAAKITWDFGDGKTETTTLSPLHRYKSQGNYNVCLKVEDPITRQSDEYCQFVAANVVNVPKQEMTQQIFTIYPNPITEQAFIEYSIPNSTQVTIDVYNILGTKIKQLTNNYQNPGIYTLNWQVNSLKSGVYFIQLNAAGKKTIKKIIIQK